MSKQGQYKSNDGTSLSFMYKLNEHSRTCIILIHGFSGSSEYFTRNIPALSEKHSVVACDLRGHGESDHTLHGYHVNRLAADIRDLIAHIRTALLPGVENLIGVGCSIGAAILWSYVELFTCSEFAKFVFVDQAPMQNYSPSGDWGGDRGNYGCHDAASTAWNQANLVLDFAGANEALVQGCLGYRFKPLAQDKIGSEEAAKDMEFFTDISKKCHPEWLSKLIGDHTQYDHRDTLKSLVNIPTLVMAGKRSGCFPLAGSLATVEFINSNHEGLASGSEFDSGHWLFYEDAARFNHELLHFIED